MRTYFHDFIRDNGLPITVEYGVDGSYTPDTYSPHLGADGGDAPEFSILKAWPNTPGHERLARLKLRLWLGWKTKFGWWLGSVIAWPLRTLMRLDEWWRASLTVAETERIEAYLAEHYIEEDDDHD